MKFITSFLLTIGFSFLSWATSKEENIEFRVSFGEELTIIRLMKSSASGEMILHKSHHPEVKRKISADDFNYIQEKVAQLPAVSNSKTFCSRSFIEIESGDKTKLACINGQNALSQQVTKLVNFLMIQF